MQLVCTILTNDFMLLGPSLLIDVPRDENITGKFLLFIPIAYFVNVSKG
jgi:hypothetical protein